MKKAKTINIPDLTEYTDESGKKWIQTSTEDLFSMKELNTIIENIESEKASGEVVLARIDFQKVNKEYYEATLAMQDKLKKQTELIKKIVADTKNIIDKKNKKLKELIEYIKKLHAFLTYINSDGSKLNDIKIPQELLTKKQDIDEQISVYENVKEVELDENLKDKNIFK